MAEDFVDIAGRVIQATEGLAKEIRDGMQSAVSNVKEFSDRDSARNSTLEDIKSLMGQLNQLSTDVGDIKNVVQQSIQMHTARQQGGPESEAIKDILTGVEQIVQGISVSGTGGSQDKSTTEQANETSNAPTNRPMQVEVMNTVRTETRVISIPETRTERLVGDQMGGGKPPISIPSDTSGGGDAKKQNKLFTQAGQKTILRQVQRLAGGILGIIAAVTGGVSISRIFEGTIKEELDYDKLMGRIAKRTHALGDSTATLRDNFTDIGDRLQHSLQTGFKIGRLMEAQVKAQRRGLKDQKKNEKFLKSAMVLSTLTDMSVESTTEAYSNWSQYFNFTNMELANVTRSMTQIARQTGITGKNLEDAIKSAEKFNRSLRASGVATSGMVTQTTKLMALAKKYGIEDVMGPLMEGLTGGFGKYMDLSSEMQSQLMRLAGGDAALQMEIKVGRGLDPKNAKKIGENFSNLVQKSIVIDLDGDGVTDALEDVDLTKLSAAQLLPLQAMAQRAFGMGLEDLQKQIKVFQEAGKTTDDLILDAQKDAIKSIIEINNMRADGLIGEAMKQTMINNARLATENKINDLRQDDRMKALGALSDLASGKQIDFIKGIKDIDPNQMGLKFGAAMQQSMKNLDKGLAEGTIEKPEYDLIVKQMGGSPAELQEAFAKAIESGDQAKIIALNDKLVQLSETGQVVDMKGASTQDKIEYQLNNINSAVRNIIGPKIQKLLDMMGARGMIMTGIAATLVAAISTLGILLVTIFPKQMARLLSKPFRMFAARGGKKGAMNMALLGSKTAKTGRFAKAGAHFGDMGRTLKGGAKGALDPMTKQLTKGGKFVKGSFEKVLGPPLRGAANKLDDLGKATVRQTGNLKRAVTGSRAGQAIGRGTAATKGFVGKQAGRVAGGVDTVARKALTGGKWVKNTKAIKGLSTGVRALGGSSTKVFGMLGKAGLQGARGIGATAKALTSWTIVIPLALAAVDGFIGAMTASGKAAEIFGVKQDEVTNSMRMASEGAAFWTGILDGISFGFASKWVGATGTWTIALAKVFDKFKILSIIMQAIIIPMKVLWGVIVGLWKFLKHSFIGLWEGIKLAIEPMVKLFGWLGDSISSAFDDIFGGGLKKGLGGFMDSTSGLMDIVGMVAKPFELLGKALGWVFKMLGHVNAMILKFLIPVFKVLWNVGMMLVKAVLRPIIDVFKSWWEVGKTFIALFTGSGSLKDRFKDFGKAVMTYLLNFFGMVPKMLWNAIKGIGPMLWKGLVAGLTLIFTYGPKIVSWLWGAIKDGFSALTSGEFWVGVWDGLKSGISTAGTWISDAVSGFFGGMIDGAVEWLENMYNDIVGWFKKMWHMIVGGSIIPDMVNDIIAWFLKLPLKILKAVGGMVLKIIKFFIKLPITVLKLLIKGAKMWFDLIIGMWDKVIEFIGFDWLTNAWKNFKNMLKDPFGFLSKAWNSFKDGLSMVNPFNWDWESMWPDFLTKKYWSKMFSGWSITLPDWLTWNWWSKKFKVWASYLPSWPEWMTVKYWVNKWDNFKMPKVFQISWWVNTFSRIGTAIADTFVSTVDWVVNAIRAAFTGMIGAILTMLGGISLPIPQFSLKKTPPFIDWEWKNMKLFGGAADTGKKMTAKAKDIRKGEAARQQINPLKGKATESAQAVVALRKTLDDNAAKWTRSQHGQMVKLLKIQQADKTNLLAKIKASKVGDAGGWTATRAKTQERANEVSINRSEFESRNNAWLPVLASKLEAVTAIEKQMAKVFEGGILTDEEKAFLKTMKPKLKAAQESYANLLYKLKGDKLHPKGRVHWGLSNRIRKEGRFEGIPKKVVDDMIAGTIKLRKLDYAQDSFHSKMKSMEKGIGRGSTAITEMQKHYIGNKSDVRVKQLKEGFYDHTPKGGKLMKLKVDAAREKYLLDNLAKMVITLEAKKKDATTRQVRGYGSDATRVGASKEQLRIMQDLIDKAKLDLSRAKYEVESKKAVSSIVIRQRIAQPKDALPGVIGSMGKLLPDPKPIEKAAKKSLTPGSIYVHDIHVENVLTVLLGKLIAVADYVVHILKNPYGEVSLPKSETGETRTLTPEESAELKLQRHKAGVQPQQVSVYSATAEEMQKIGLDQVTQLIAIKEGINKLVSLFDSKVTPPIGTGTQPPGSTATQFAANSRKSKEWGEAPFSSANEPGMQGVVSQVGMS